jgi:hypothetical protein
MPIDYQALKTGSMASVLPDDGEHAGRLERAQLVHTQNGPRLVTEWSQANGTAQWTSWNRFDESGLSYTIELLDGLGVDRAAVNNDEQLDAELERAVDQVFDVRTSSQAGSRGDGRVFVSTYVTGRNQGIQDALDGVLPVDTSDLPPPVSAGSKVHEDDDDKIPF